MYCKIKRTRYIMEEAKNIMLKSESELLRKLKTKKSPKLTTKEKPIPNNFLFEVL